MDNLILYFVAALAWAYFEHYIFDVCNLHIGAPNFLLYLRAEYHIPMAVVVAGLTYLLAQAMHDNLYLLLFLVWLFLEDMAYIVILLVMGATWKQACEADLFGNKTVTVWMLLAVYTAVVIHLLT